ncbi:gamma-glutamylcyclotransferase family protein [Algibacter luteus]|nr:gamma-glutamylcyclotransferase family protein [Algibacter luteus]WJJ95263.1 gamma-glutamylcyclotransferase family protein [Algibacter luteus]
MSIYLNKNSDIVGRASFQGKLYNVTWFPGAVLSNNKTDFVYGTIFKMNHSESVLDVLDGYEDFDANNPEFSLFKREIITATLQDGSKLKAWIYLYNQPINKLKEISSGDYLKEIKKK